MASDRSAYAALGLEPHADQADVERAYKRLIKLYHPDRDGGDAIRAAEINRAYRELRGRPLGPEDLELADQDQGSGEGWGWVVAAMVLVVSLAALLVATGPVTALIRDLSPSSPPRLAKLHGGGASRDLMDQPIQRASVEHGVRDAQRILGKHDDSALLDASRECHRLLRLQPDLTQLDRCAAFDDAVTDLQNHDPMWDRGPFSALAVAERQWSAASALSNDYLAVDGRLERIRLQVELAVASSNPRTPPATPR